MSQFSILVAKKETEFKSKKMANLVDWITNDLKFTNQKEAEEIAKVLNKGSTKKIFEFLAQKVKLKNDVEVIRGNLRLQEIQDEDHAIEDENDDLYEAKVLKKSLKKVKLQSVQVEHDIERLQRINAELSVTQQDLKSKLVANAAQVQQLSDHYRELNGFKRNIELNDQELVKWIQSREYSMEQNDTSPILDYIDNLKPKILSVLKDGDKVEMSNDQLAKIHPQILLQGLLESTRRTELKVNEELEKSVETPDQSQAQKILEELYERHIESYKLTVQAEQRSAKYQLETERLINDHFKSEKDESLKRNILLKHTKKSAEVMIQSLKMQIQQLKNEDSKAINIKMAIKDGFEVMDKQAQAISNAKTLIEDLIGQNSGFTYRVLQSVNQVQEQKSNAKNIVSADIFLKSKDLALNAIQFIHDPKILQNLSIDRLASQPKLPKILEVSYKPSIGQFLKIVHEIQEQKKSLSQQIEEMQELEKFDTNTLQKLKETLMGEKQELMDLIARKLAKTDEKETDYCEKFLHAVKIFVNEPAKDVYMKEIKKEIHGKNLEEWYTYLKSQN